MNFQETKNGFNNVQFPPRDVPAVKHRSCIPAFHATTMIPCRQASLIDGTGLSSSTAQLVWQVLGNKPIGTC